MKLLIGAGRNKREGWISLDIDDSTEPNIIADANKELPIKSGTVSEIEMRMVIEHIIDLNKFFSEAYRVLDRGGILTISTCNFSFWRARLKFLFGQYEKTSAFSVWHCWLFKPSQLQLIATSHDFDAVITGKGLFPYPDLFYYEFILTCRKRG